MIYMLVPEDLQCLKAIALLGGHREPVWISSQSLGKSLSISPQTASRRLKSLEEGLLISRVIRADGQYVTLTETGERELRVEYTDYARIFERHGRYSLQGAVISGLGEGRYYMSLPDYRQQFARHLGYEPYPGTLNLRLSALSAQVKKKLEGLPWIGIEGFSTDNRTFGAAKALPCRIQDVPCAIVVPGRSHYPEDVIEVISPIGLRERFSLNDRDLVTIEVDLA
jgi:riboflavin kinase, archaea type